MAHTAVVRRIFWEYKRYMLSLRKTISGLIFFSWADIFASGRKVKILAQGKKIRPEIVFRKDNLWFLYSQNIRLAFSVCAIPRKNQNSHYSQFLRQKRKINPAPGPNLTSRNIDLKYWPTNLSPRIPRTKILAPKSVFAKATYTFYILKISVSPSQHVPFQGKIKTRTIRIFSR